MGLYINPLTLENIQQAGKGDVVGIESDQSGTYHMQNAHWPTSGFRLTNFRSKYGHSWVVNATAPASGTAWATPISIPGGERINNITFVSGTTAGATLTHQWFGLADANLKIVAVTADDTSTAWGASTAKTLAIGNVAGAAATAYKVPDTTPQGRPTLYYAVICVAASTVPTIHGVTSSAWAVGQVPKSGSTDLTSQTTPAASDSSVTLVVTGVTHVPLVGLS